MNRKQEAKVVASLTPRARKLFARIKDEGRFYKSYGKNIPKAMAELERAGLVMETGRVEVICSAYVPVRGFKPFRMEEWAR